MSDEDRWPIDPAVATDIPLYGYQGAVVFDINVSDSLVDAVVRLMGPQRKVNLAVYTRHGDGDSASASGPGDNDTGAVSILTDVAAGDYGYAHVRALFAPDGAKDAFALFVYSGSETPPSATITANCWEPAPTNTGTTTTTGEGASVVLRCGSYSYIWNVNIPDPRLSVDVAYLRVPANAKNLQTNVFQEWLVVVARILTPGAGLAALHNGTAGVVPRCSFVLMGFTTDARSKPLASSAYDLAPFNVTPGGLTFRSVSWHKLASHAERCAEKDSAGVPTTAFGVMPLEAAEIALHVPGSMDRHTVPPWPPSHWANHKVRPVHSSRSLVAFRDDLRSHIKAKIRKLKDELNESFKQKRLWAVDIWPTGFFWDAHEWPVRIRWPVDEKEGAPSSSVAVAGSSPPSSPCPISAVSLHEVFGGSGRWPLNYDGTIELPVLMTMRPVFQTYRVFLPLVKKPFDDATKWVSVEVDLDGSLDAFRRHLRETVSAIDVDVDSLYLLQRKLHDYNPVTFSNEYPVFLLTPATTDDNWTAICRQRVTPELWVVKAPAAHSLPADVNYTVDRWGFRREYDNLKPMRHHTETHHQARAASPSLVDGDDDDTGGYEDVNGDNNTKDITSATNVGGATEDLGFGPVAQAVGHSFSLDPGTQNWHVTSSSGPVSAEQAAKITSEAVAEAATIVNAANTAREDTAFASRMLSRSEGAQMDRAVTDVLQMALRRTLAWPLRAPQHQQHQHQPATVRTVLHGSVTINGKTVSGSVVRDFDNSTNDETHCMFCNHVFNPASPKTDKADHLVRNHWEELAESSCEDHTAELRAALLGYPESENATQSEQGFFVSKRVLEDVEEEDEDAGDTATTAVGEESHARKAKRRKTTKTLKDSDYRPGNDTEDDKDDSVDDDDDKALTEDDSANNVGQRAAKRRRKAAGIKDPTYRPGKDAEDTEDVDDVKGEDVAKEVEAIAVAEATATTLEPVSPIKQKGKKAGKKAKQSADKKTQKITAKRIKKTAMAKTAAKAPVRRSPRLLKRRA